MSRYHLKITSSQQAEAENAAHIVAQVAKETGAALQARPQDRPNTRKILETGLSLEFLIGLPAGVAVGMIANEIHRRLLRLTEKPERITLAERASEIVITHNETGLQITLRMAEDSSMIEATSEEAGQAPIDDGGA
ncbi:hypothetical protein I5535_07020 [Rhodobacteraceae bacterium F11138]|nr:hypothetical protein [Rhodobacteraceae bacterium F11138]